MPGFQYVITCVGQVQALDTFVVLVLNPVNEAGARKIIQERYDVRALQPQYTANFCRRPAGLLVDNAGETP